LRVVRLIEKAARALHAAHEAGIVHRDVKPGNILVTPTSEPVLLDFGLAGEVAGELSAFTRTGELFGTPAYMSPEQLLAKRIRLDRRTDVYSLGATLYECVTLRRPFEAPTREALYHAIEVKDPPNPRKLNPLVPADLKVVLEKALEKDRDRRYPTAEAFADDLQRVRTGEPITVRPVSRAGRAVRWARRRPFHAVVLLTLVIGLPLVTGLGAYVIRSLPDIRAGWAQVQRDKIEGCLQQGFSELAEHDDKTAYDRAIGWFDQALAADPKCLEALAGKVSALNCKQRYQEALDFLDAHRTLENAHPALLHLRRTPLYRLDRQAELADLEKRLPDPTTALERFIEGGIQLRDCNVQKDPSVFRNALHEFERAALLSPHACAIHLHQLAHAAGHLGDETASRMVDRVLRASSPKRAMAWWWAGYALHKVDPPAAIAAYRTAIRLNKNFLWAHGSLGTLLYRKKAFSEALDAYRAALDLDPGDSFRHVQLARALLEVGRPDEAIEACHKALQLEPDNASAHAQLAWAIERRSGLENLSDGAVQDLLARHREAIRLDSEHAFSFFRIGVILLERKHDDAGALSAFQRACALRPENASAWENVGAAHDCLKQFDAAIAAYREALQLDPSAHGVHFRLGVLLHNRGERDEAIKHLREAVRLAELDSQKPFCRYLTNLAGAYLSKDECNLALQACLRVLEIEPDNVEARKFRTLVYVKQKRWHAALVQLRLLAEAGGVDAMLCNNLGAEIMNIHLEESSEELARGAWQDAAAFFLTAIWLDPQLALPHQNLAVAYAHLGRFDDAIAATETALRMDQQHARAGPYATLGVFFHNTLKDYERAIPLFRKAIELDGTRAAYHVNLAKAYHSTELYEEAIAACDRALDLDSHSVGAHLVRGRALSQTERVDEAVAELQRAIEIDATRADAHHLLGMLLHDRKRDYEGAIACFLQANRLQPGIAVFHANLGKAYLSRGDFDPAIQAFRAAIEAKENEDTIGEESGWPIMRWRFDVGWTYARLGVALARSGRLEEAIQFLEDAAARLPESAQMHCGLAEILTNHAQDYPAAIRHARRALALEPDNASTHSNAAAVLGRLGRYDEALASGRRALRLLGEDTSEDRVRNHYHAGSITGQILFETGQLQQAREVLESGLSPPEEPPSGRYCGILARVLVALGRYDESLAMLRSAREKGPGQDAPDDGRSAALNESTRVAERLVDLEGRLEAVLRGEERPHSGEGCALLAVVLRARQEHATATRFFAEAFARDAAVAFPVKEVHRYRVDAARSAVLAGSGQGSSGPALTLTERAQFRQQALRWLEEELTYLVEDFIPPRDAIRAIQPGRYEMLRELRRWEVHVDFADVRDVDGLARLPAAEREAWIGFWHRVEATALMLEGDAR
ncbi:MAG: tetratricopeptide repeat protein, partial [Polyangiaceae bacterium]|nr:tetratricopeptide repeat protein [Polyangiaceae bacterium]